MSSYIVAMKDSTSVLVENATSVSRFENFVDFHNQDLMIASFNVDNLSHFTQACVETVKLFKNPNFSTPGNFK